MSRKKTKKRRFSGRFAIFFTILLFVCTIIFFNIILKGGSFSKLAYRLFGNISGSATEPTIFFDESETNRHALADGKLCVISPETLSTYKSSGKGIFSEPVLLRSPAVASSHSRFIAYDLGGLNYYVASSKKLLYIGQANSKILNVNLNKSGDFAILTDDPNYKTLVTVYDKNFKSIFKFHSSEKYVFDAAVSPNGKNAAMLMYSAKNGVFETSLSLCKTNENKFYSTVSLDSAAPIKVSYLGNNKILVITDKGVSVYDDSGKALSQTDFGGLPLRAYDGISEKNIVFLLDDYKSGGNSKILLLDKDGNFVSEHKFNSDIYSISSKGKYFSLQFSDKCSVYTGNMKLCAEHAIPLSINLCIQKKNGAVLAVSNNSAAVCIK